jgi:small-conductance mechanosensitive channel
VREASRITITIIVILIAISAYLSGFYTTSPKITTIIETMTITMLSTVTHAITSTITMTQIIIKEFLSKYEVRCSIAIVDSAEGTVTIEREPQRVIAQFSYVRGGLLALDIANKIVDTDDHT